MITGGRNGFGFELAEVLQYDSKNLYNEPEKMKSMIYERSTHACTIFNSILHDGRPILLAAGGWVGGSGGNTAEMFDFTKEGSSWQESNLIFAFISSVVIYFFKDVSDFQKSLAKPWHLVQTCGLLSTKIE